ncbi:PASTA domain-containing protein, partial [Streptomyces sp. DT225]
GFTVTVDSVESDQAEPGTVLEQSPKGGEKAEENSEITLKVATEELLTMPPVTDRSYDAAVAQLNGVGFKNIGRSDVDSDKPAGQVVEQTPVANEKVGKDTSIILKVSKGPPEPEKVAVPGDLLNKSYQDAKAQLEGMGLVVALQPG